MAAITDSQEKSNTPSRRRAKGIQEKGSHTDDDTEQLPDHKEDTTLKALDDIKNKLESLHVATYVSKLSPEGAISEFMVLKILRMKLQPKLNSTEKRPYPTTSNT